MPFNAQTYRRNQYRAKAKAEIAQARDIQARAAAGTAYDWEAALVPGLVIRARCAWHIYLSLRRL